MKVHELAPDADLLCQDSLSLLSQKIRAFFDKEFPKKELWFPDDTSQWTHFKKSSPNVHIVLYGNLLRSLAELPYWPGENVYLWVLSESSRLSAIEILGIKTDQISVIPRTIFEQNERNQTPLSRKFVYAGRISRQKNILDLLFTLYFLQQEHSPEFQLQLYGSFDNEYNQDCGRIIFDKTFEDEILLLISKLNWKKAPQFKGKKISLEWPNLLSSDNTLISLSRFLMEDFGVSVAQVHERGIATITSDWGGYKDIEDKNNLKISSHLLSTDLTPLGIRLAHTRKIANIIATTQLVDSSAQNPTNNNRPQLISRSEMFKIHERFVQIAGPQAVLLSRDQLAPYADTIEGKVLLGMIEKHFETQTDKNIVVIVSKLGTNLLEENQQLYCAFGQGHYENTKKVIMDGTQAMQKWAMASMMKSSEIIMTSEALKQFPQLNEVLKNIHSNIIYLEKSIELPLGLKEFINFE